MFLPAAEPVATSEASDITETGGLRPIKPADRSDAPPPAAAEPSAVATVGKQVESIPPGDSVADAPVIAEPDAAPLAPAAREAAS